MADTTTPSAAGTEQQNFDTQVFDDLTSLQQAGPELAHDARGDHAVVADSVAGDDLGVLQTASTTAGAMPQSSVPEGAVAGVTVPIATNGADPVNPVPPINLPSPPDSRPIPFDPSQHLDVATDGQGPAAPAQETTFATTDVTPTTLEGATLPAPPSPAPRRRGSSRRPSRRRRRRSSTPSPWPPIPPTWSRGTTR